jgi:Tfp pilus assembly protein PilV
MKYRTRSCSVSWKNRRAGQTIIEVVIATGVVALVMTAVVAIVSVSLRNTTRAKAKVLATKYTQEGIEYFRAQRNLLGWESMFQAIQQGSGGSTYCMSTLPYGEDGGLASLPNRACLPNEFVDSRQIYQRSAEITTTGSDTLTITVTVTWNDGDRTQTSNATAELKQSQN